ncbi:hypothetical protein [Patulibacter defluvii]|uniref:hypothetical protein n=1 Tax=Patulibacter defluvii TaxID=3095358 RepID=UPI002A75B5BF|nr:hypothetical protein [Patulibacter sp. DM4]
MGSADRRKTSFEVDFAKVDAVKQRLGTRTLTATVDAALDEVLLLDARRRAVELLMDPEATDIDDEELMRSAWR